MSRPRTDPETAQQRALHRKFGSEYLEYTRGGGAALPGVRCEDPVVFPGYVTYCTFYDPFGNRLQMCSEAKSET